MWELGSVVFSLCSDRKPDYVSLVNKIRPYTEKLIDRFISPSIFLHLLASVSIVKNLMNK